MRQQHLPAASPSWQGSCAAPTKQLSRPPPQPGRRCWRQLAGCATMCSGSPTCHGRGGPRRSCRWVAGCLWPAPGHSRRARPPGPAPTVPAAAARHSGSASSYPTSVLATAVGAGLQGGASAGLDPAERRAWESRWLPHQLAQVTIWRPSPGDPVAWAARSSGVRPHGISAPMGCWHTARGAGCIGAGPAPTHPSGRRRRSPAPAQRCGPAPCPLPPPSAAARHRRLAGGCRRHQRGAAARGRGAQEGGGSPGGMR
jgi:hypothetical protein